MKIGFVVTNVAVAPGWEKVVSAHVQLPIHTMQLMAKAGHEVQLITTSVGQDQIMPPILPPETIVHQLPGWVWKASSPPMLAGRSEGHSFSGLIQLVHELVKIVRSERYDILHFFGSNKIAALAGLLSMFGIRTPRVLTYDLGIPRGMPRVTWFAKYTAWKQISAIVTSTEFMQNHLRAMGVRADLARPGVGRNIRDELNGEQVDQPKRVVYWRDPSIGNGADICLQVYSRLAPRFPNISFDLAVRPHPNPVEGIDELAHRFPNVHVARFPYSNGMSIAKLLAESVCVLLPFRGLIVHPQFAILESMRAGCAVVTTAVGSTTELIESGRNGYLVPVGDIEATISAVKGLLIDRSRAVTIGNQAAADICAKWKWPEYALKIARIYSRALRM